MRVSLNWNISSRRGPGEPPDRGPSRGGRRVSDERGASLVEMSIVAGLFLLLLFAIIEFGRFIAVYSAVQTASREAARYGTGVGDSPNGVPRYTDCTEIRNAGRLLSSVVTLADGDISVTYDEGPGTSQSATCPAGSTISPAAITVGDRIVVTVTKTFDSGMPLIGTFLDGIQITATDRRTIFNDQP